MQGITMKSLYEVLQNAHDVEFIYDGTTYVIQPELDEDGTFLVIWDCTQDAPNCIAKKKIRDQNTIDPQNIDAVLSEKCFDGKSFMEIEKDVKVTIIY